MAQMPSGPYIVQPPHNLIDPPMRVFCVHRSVHVYGLAVCLHCLTAWTTYQSRRRELYEATRREWRDAHPLGVSGDDGPRKGPASGV